MHCVRKVTEDLYWVGSNDRRLELFENIFPIQKGVSYNSYLLLDEKTVLFDTVDNAVGRQFLENIAAVLNGRTLDYLDQSHGTGSLRFDRGSAPALSGYEADRKRQNISDDRSVLRHGSWR